MYERNINLLEIFVEKKLGYVETNNIKNNYFDYKELVKVLGDYINICEEEKKAKEDYSAAVTNIQDIQKTTEKLYKQNVKFEYSRSILFSDVNRKVEDIEKCLTKIEAALDKNKDSLKNLRKNFIQGIISLNEKERALKKITRPKNKIEIDYKDSLALITDNYHSINPADIELTKKFIESAQDMEEELIEKMMHNGKNEKVPFDENAITVAAKLGLDIAQKEAENYLFMYEQTGKILNEIATNKLKLDARKKHITDVGVKLSFLQSEKDYLMQFLDNERVTAIQGEKEHKRLMKNCCNILTEDVAQFNTLYDLILKETKKRATNRCYEELYNKSYLENIEEKEKQFIEKTTNLDYANGTIISPNYWRIDSIKAIYENFDKMVYETYGRKFVAPADKDANAQPKVVERVVERVVEKVVEKPVERIIEKIPESYIESLNKKNIIESTVEAQPIIEQEQKSTNIDEIVDNKNQNETIIPEIIENTDTPISKESTVAEDQSTNIQKASKEDTSKDVAKSSAKTKKATKKEISSEEEVSVKADLKDKSKAQPTYKFKRVKKVAQASSDDISDEDLEEESIFSKASSESDEFSDIEDLEAIIEQAKESISSKSKKASIIKKMVKKNKGKYAAD